MNAEATELTSEKLVPFHIWFAGADGLGSAMTGLRQSLGDRAYVTGSMLPTSFDTLKSTFPLRKGERNRGDHFLKTAHDIEACIANENHIVIELHSGGMWEFLHVADYFDPRIWKSKRIDIVLLGSPGVVESGIGSFFKRFLGVAGKMMLLEQHSVCPVASEKYYARVTKEYPNTYGDTADRRKERRERFLGYMDRLEPNAKKRKKVKDDVLLIDLTINKVHSSEVDKLLQKRAKILAPYIHRMFIGKQIPDAVHREIMGKYEEVLTLREKWKLLLPSIIASVGTFAQSLWRTHRGTSQYLSSIMTTMRKNGGEVKLRALVAEHDPMIKPTEIGLVAQAFQSCASVEIAPSMVVQDWAHASYGINAWDTRKILDKLFPN